ncbi:dipeptide ABC transporter ATP-binding protein [Haloferacaceae archaeon DSL9]
MTNVLTVRNLHAQFDTYDGTVRAVDGVSFTVDRGEIVGIVGESGCGKSVTARSILGLQAPGRVVDGSVRLDGVEMTTAGKRDLRRLRGDVVSMVFQEPTETLNPVFDVGEQIAESLKVHENPRSQRLLDYLRVPPFSSRSDWKRKRERAIELMEQVGIASPADRVNAYPHELSGGMRQRACLAIALASNPQLLIADEPTTALDTTTQAQILDELRRLNAERDLAILLITHDLGVVAELCDRVVVMYAGEVMETGPTDRLLKEPRHPYTRALFESLLQRSPAKTRLPTIEGRVPSLINKPSGCAFEPRCEYATERCRTDPIPAVDADGNTVACGEPIALEPHVDAEARARSSVDADTSDATTSSSRTDEAVDRSIPTVAGGSRRIAGEPLVELRNVSKRYPLQDGLTDRLLGETRHVRAVTDIDLEIAAGETVGLVGESGSGKSTLAGLVTGLEAPTGGEIRFDGRRVGPAAERSDETLADVGVLFQNPRSSLNPRLTVERSIAEPLAHRGWDASRRERRVRDLLELVGLSETRTSSFPHELSGGQIQRVAIARALALDPDLLVLDEPASALDASVKARILNLLSDLQRELGLTYLLISHDLDVVRHVADRVAVLYLGRLMEVGPTTQVFDRPAHPYTRALLEAIPSIDPGDRGVVPVRGEIPSPIDPPAGCPFHTRCPMAEDECRADEPPMTTAGAARSRCHFSDEIFDSRTKSNERSSDVRVSR